jgi:SAM-dependent methyltransferase
VAALYDTIGTGYRATRATDPRIAARIWAALGGARTVLNVGAGTGNYEPPDRAVVALEPSRVMIGQRPAGRAPAVQGIAEALPFGDGSFDAAMAVLSDHHWSDRVAAAVEMRRVTQGPIAVFTFDPARTWDSWITRDYLPAFETLVPPYARMEELAEAWGDCTIEPVAIPWDCEDGFYHAFWRRPEAYLDPAVRNGISVFARVEAGLVEEGMARLRDDLASGEWAQRNAAILDEDELDLGYRLLVSRGNAG